MTIVYRPMDNTRGTLISLSPDGDDVLLDGFFGSVNLFDYHGNLYEPTRFQFTSDEGEVYIVDQRAGLEQMSDRNGNTLLITDAGVLWTNTVTGDSGLGITFVRDAEGRIEEIIDPNTNSLRYAYNAGGGLSAFTDRVTNTTSFAYTNVAFPHYLTEITDPRGFKAVRTEYDDSGRMVRQIDAAGHVVEFTHDLANNAEIIRDRLGHVTVHEYDDRGNVVRTIDALNNATTMKYDDLDNLVEQIDALGNANRFTYDNRFNKLTETDPLGNTTSYTYGPFRELTSMTNPRGFTTTNRYDGNGNLTEERDPLGHATAYAYDLRGNLLTRTDALGHVLSNRYDNLGRMLETAVIDAERGVLNQTWFTYDANGNQLTKTVKRTTGVPPVTEYLTTTFVYDSENRVTKTIHPDGSTNTSVYALGLDQPAAEIDPLGRQTLHFYDERGNETNIVYADTTSETTLFDAENRTIVSIDKLGRTMVYTNDALGRVTALVWPDGAVSNVVYDAIGRIVTSVDERGNATHYAYDPNCGCSGRQAFITNALGQVTKRSYDENANEVIFKDALGRTTTFLYDPLDRRTYTLFEDGTWSLTTYDALGRRIAETDQSTNTTWFAYDALGRLLAVTNALGQVTTYAYDETGRLIAQTDAENRTTRFEYDAMGRRTQRTLPMGQVETYQYDLAGNLTNKVDFNGRATAYAYDELNRLLSKTPDGSFAAPPVSFTYTATGQRESMTDESGSSAYAYNARDWLTNKTVTWNLSGGSMHTITLTYSYDEHGNLTGIQSSTPDGVALAYTYDVLNRVAAAIDARVGTTTYSYDAIGNLMGYQYPNGVTNAYEFDSLNRLTNLSTLNSQLSTVASYRYTVLASGHRKTAAESVVAAGGAQTINRIYNYDAIYRLTGETLAASVSTGLPGSAGVSYTHDDVGNRLTRTSSLPGVDNQTFNYDSNDRLTSDGYDANGNTITSTLGADTYDFEDRLIRRETTLNSQPTTINLLYDGDGQRVAKTIGNTTTFYLVDEQNLTGYAQVLEEHVSINHQPPTINRLYAYGLDLISQDRVISSQSGSAWIVSFYGYDGHGNVRYLSDGAADVTDTYDYDAFGNLIAQTGSTPNSYLYCGEQFDADLGLYYNRARYLNAESGRFWNRDKIEEKLTCSSFTVYLYHAALLNKYVFADSDPVNKHDPTGFQTLTETQTALTQGTRVSTRIARPAAKAYKRTKSKICKIIAFTSYTANLAEAVVTTINVVVPSTAGPPAPPFGGGPDNSWGDNGPDCRFARETPKFCYYICRWGFGKPQTIKMPNKCGCPDTPIGGGSGFFLD